MSDLGILYAELAYHEDQLEAAGLRGDPPVMRAADGYELSYFADVFKNRMRRNGLDREGVQKAFEYGVEQLNNGLALCESPIERRFCHWLVFGKWQCRHPEAMAPLVLLPGDPLPRYTRFAIAPQREAGPYRLDFAVLVRVDGETLTVAVECDGKDFHDAERDKGRDQWLLKHRVQTFRATGSEIFRKPQEAFERLDRSIPRFRR